MKKLFALALFLFFSIQFSLAQYYYQPYPLAAQIASNGIEWRMECSVFDSLLATIQYYNGPWCTVQLNVSNDNMGMASYESQPGAADSYGGGVIYDMELHTFQSKNDSCIGCYCTSYSCAAGGGAVNFNKIIDEYLFTYECSSWIYDLKASSWIGTSYMGEDAWGGAGYDYFADFGEAIFEGGYQVEFFSPYLHTWNGIMDGSWSYSQPQTGGDLVSYQDDDMYNGGETFGRFVLASPDGIIPELSFDDGDFFGSLDRNIFYQDYYKNPSIKSLYISTADIFTNSWKSDSLDGIEMNSISCNKNVYSVRDTGNTIITYGVYSYPQHAWITGRDTLNYIASDTIIKGTVYFTDSSGVSYTRGYIDSIGWGNYITPPQPIFHLASYNTASTGNLVYVKDYSIGTDSVFFDYGDGFTTKRRFDYHLYKVNGHYRTASATNFNVCMTAYQNGAAITPSCQVVNFVTALDEPVKQTPITIASKGNSNILDITNKDGHALQVKVFDAAGRQIRNFSNTSNRLMLSLKTLSTGMYVVQVYDEQTHDTITGKFVKR